MLSRYEVLSYGVRAYADLPYVALVLAALAIESRRRQAGWPVLALLALAGLLRPEAWLFAGVYWLSIQHAYSMRGRVALAALVALAPALWVLSDGLVTGHPLWSLTNTRSTAKELHRATGIANVPYYGARRLGEVLGPDGLVGAALGGVLALWLTRSRALLGAAAGIVALVAFAIIAAAGLPIQDRYVFLMSAILLVFAGAGLFGWRSLAAEDPRRRLWQAASAVIAVAVLASIAWDVPRFQKTFTSSKPADQSLDAQQRIANDLVAIVPHAHCLPVSVPFATPVPLLALYLHTSPANVEVAQIGRGTIIVPASAAVRTDVPARPHDRQITQRIGPGFRQVAANRSWRVYSRC